MRCAAKRSAVLPPGWTPIWQSRWQSTGCEPPSTRGSLFATRPAAGDSTATATDIARQCQAPCPVDDPAGTEELVKKFRDSAIESEQAIDTAGRTADLPGLAAAAHRLKGAAQAVGAARLGAAAD